MSGHDISAPAIRMMFCERCKKLSFPFLSAKMVKCTYRQRPNFWPKIAVQRSIRMNHINTP